MLGMGMRLLPVPVHKLTLGCGLVQGEVSTGVRPAFPVEGIDMKCQSQAQCEIHASPYTGGQGSADQRNDSCRASVRKLRTEPGSGLKVACG